ncbi:MAG: beta-lactamase family protein [Methanospirillum sp.]|uniref:serine hydrolase domain-containing protein n=1 Tax=Methanospirillum sp. TaxID=45200 RepID=UPI00236EE2F3|nr:serine hydrolase domain-containing protein [Methanospirillum sp.]MDD1728135.1 beta-lactamase family protein [Methanospirillum sp.]
MVLGQAEYRRFTAIYKVHQYVRTHLEILAMNHYQACIILLSILFLITSTSGLPTPDEWRTTAYGHFSSLTKEDVDPFISTLITYNQSKGMVVVLVDRDGYCWYSYGTLTTKDDDSPDNRTLFDIGSVSKVMTGLLMADGEIRGEYNLTAPVNTWLPDQYHLNGEGQTITGADLATHRSGLPVTPEVFALTDPAATGADQLEESMRHYQTMTADETYQWLANTTLYSPPGYEYLYSNLGGAVAGDSIARAAGVPYPQLFEERIAIPLDMTSTGASWTIEDLNRRATGYRGYEYPADEAHLIRFNEFWTATGGIHSNADDMAVFLAAQLGLIETPLVDAIAMTHTPRFTAYTGPPLLEQGIFWDILHNRDGTIIIKKPGETNAHQAVIAFNPTMGAGVVILSNTATVGGTHVEGQAIALLERMQVKKQNQKSV